MLAHVYHAPAVYHSHHSSASGTRTDSTGFNGTRTRKQHVLGNAFLSNNTHTFSNDDTSVAAAAAAAAARTRRNFSVSIFLTGFNEQILLPKVWAFYRTQFPNAHLYLIDDWSTDNSTTIARLLGMTVIRVGTRRSKTIFPTPNITRNNPHTTIWKQVVQPGTWVITADIDELLCMSEEELAAEDALGTTIFRTAGHDMIAFSNRTDLSDLDLTSLRRGRRYKAFDKRIIFKAGPSPMGLDSMTYGQGQHVCTARGNVKFSSTKTPFLYHAGILGASQQIQKFRSYNERFVYQRIPGKYNPPLYYTWYKTADEVARWFLEMAGAAVDLPPISNCVRLDRLVPDPSLSSSEGKLAQRVKELVGAAPPPYQWPPSPPSPPPQSTWPPSLPPSGSKRTVCCLRKWASLKG